MPTAAIEKDCSGKMARAVEFLKQELRGIRTGRAHPGLVEHIKVEVSSYGSTMELRELATISVPEPSTLLVKPLDPGTLKDIEKGLQTSTLGVTPQSDGKAIRLPIPPLSGERRQQLLPQVKKMADAQQAAAAKGKESEAVGRVRPGGSVRPALSIHPSAPDVRGDARLERVTSAL